MTIINKFVLFGSIGLFMTGCYTNNSPMVEKNLNKPSKSVQELIEKNNLKVVDYEYVKQRVQKGTAVTSKATIFDARPENKYIVGHIPSAYLLPDVGFEEYYAKYNNIDKNKEAIVYCGGYSCTKSPIVAKLLLDKGFSDVKVYQAGMPEWEKKDYVEISSKYAKSIFDKNSALFVDARPYKLFLTQTIPGSIFIPDTEIDEFIGRAPRDLNTNIVIYCGGYKCGKSHNVANKLISLGYTNVKVYAGGLPEWQELNYPTTNSAKKEEIKSSDNGSEFIIKNGIKLVKEQDENEGMVYGKWYLEILKDTPKNIVFVDIRTPEEFNEGHIPNAINISMDRLSPKEFVEKLPKDKIVILNCVSGARAMEGFMFAKKNGADLNKIFYVDATINCNKNNQCEIKINDPL